MPDTPIEEQSETSPAPRKRLAETVADEVGRQTAEREQDQAYEDLPEPSHTPSNPGGSFGSRVSRRIQQARFEQ